ncbi:MAG: PEP-CTERM sorting domain-containing protein [Pirellulaceae bacterium]|nr:PEP-CTERM sorting domain-containing protein [Pirellulaceae bacterium]
MRFAKLLFIRGNDSNLHFPKRFPRLGCRRNFLKSEGTSMIGLFSCRHCRNTIISSMVAMLFCFFTGIVSADIVTGVVARGGHFNGINPYAIAKSELFELRDKITNEGKIGLVSVNGSASASNGELRLEVSSSVEAGLQIAGFQEMLAYASIVERGRMVWTLSGPSDPFALEFFVTAELSGNVSLSDGGNIGRFGSAGTLSLDTGLQGVVYGKTFTALDTTFTPFFQGTLAVDSQGSFRLAPSAQVGLTIISDFGTLGFGNTFKYTSILMPDGTTPESHGWRLEFESGMQSPNLVAVPEPSRVTLLVIGACTSGLSTWRRRRGEHTVRRS